ncbi:hypothetical protein DSM112329_00324 [Paraconexibacter sp. AEG42_29]|uniref:Uncharacterized protein n=1 Tax=Paraconexibacter sp. AEG42_29 TaxID=2997339 RepID=A0AAU7APH8_9ACTN
MYRVSSLVLAVAALALGGAVAATPASAGSLSTANTCRWSIDDYYRDLPIELAGSAAPAPVAPGRQATLSSATVRSRLPDWVPEYGFNLGLLHEGRNDIAATVWVATAGTGTAAARVSTATVTAATTITLDAQGNPKGTPLDVAVPLPDSLWTAPGGGTLAFAQAGPGTLPRLPLGPGGRLQQPGGSVVIQAALDKDVKITLDCHPGVSRQRGTTFDTVAAGAFESLVVQEPVVGQPAPLPVPPGPTSAPAGATVPAASVLSTALRVRGRTDVPVAVACGPGTGACFGTVELRTVAPQRIGRRVATRVVGRATFALPAGRRRSLELALTDEARILLRRRPSVAVRVRLVRRDAPLLVWASRQLVLRR